MTVPTIQIELLTKMMVTLEVLERAFKETMLVQQYSELMKAVRQYGEVARQPRPVVMQTQVVR